MRWLLVGAFVAILPAQLQAQTAEAGERIFKSCKGCHQIGDGARNRVGPVLTGVVGRPAGSFDGYRYSASMLAAGAQGLVWSGETLSAYLADPSGFLREVLGDPSARAKMTFRLKNEADRADVIAYLATFSSAAAMPPEGGFCIENASDAEHVFAVETREGARKVQVLAPGERLCSAASQAEDGVVSVFESMDGFEGCSRVIPAGKVEQMLEYAEFDRCRWGEHQS